MNNNLNNLNNQSMEDFLNSELNAIVTADGKETELLAPKAAPSGIEFLNPADFPNLDDAEEGISLETKYFEFNVPGLIVRAIFNGLGVMKKRNSVGNLEEIPAVYFQTKDGVYLNGGDNLVNQLQHCKPGTPIQITYIGKQKTASNNNVNKFDVKVLNIRNS
jgi:hypothetical protein